MTGVEALYIPKDMTSVDSILGEEYQVLHSRFYPMPVRIINPLGWERTARSDDSIWIASQIYHRMDHIP